MELRRGPIGIIVGSILICPILYCAYFDYRRRHSPTFRRLIRELVRKYRKKEKQQRLQRYKELIDKRLQQTSIPTRKYEEAALNYYFALEAYSSPHELMLSVCSDKVSFKIIFSDISNTHVELM
ncbi:hypothetical protein V1523DRAFT_415179 [Lipomyces doorenjongii]